MVKNEIHFSYARLFNIVFTNNLYLVSDSCGILDPAAERIYVSEDIG